MPAAVPEAEYVGDVSMMYVSVRNCSISAPFFDLIYGRTLTIVLIAPAPKMLVPSIGTAQLTAFCALQAYMRSSTLSIGQKKDVDSNRLPGLSSPVPFLVIINASLTFAAADMPNRAPTAMPRYARPMFSSSQTYVLRKVVESVAYRIYI